MSRFLLPCLAALGLSTSPGWAQSTSSPATPAPATPKLAPKPASAPKPLKVKVQMSDGLRFDPPRFSAEPGQEVIVTLENADTTHQQHNFLVVQPGKLKEVVQQSLELGDQGPKQGFIPVNPAILVHSEVVDPEKETEVRFTMPPQKGVYPFVCSMPGHGMIMYGAIYSGAKMPPLAKDPNLPPTAAQHAIAGNGARPFVQRIFMPDSGPASIAVALPGAQNYCWDAGECRLRYVWRGEFIDASAHWRGNGREMPVLPAVPWWHAAKGSFPLKIASANGPVKFHGYTLIEGLPEFHYSVGSTEIYERIAAAPKNAGVVRRFRIPAAPGPVELSAPGWTSSAGALPNGTLTLPPEQAKDFTVTLAEPAAGAGTPKL